MKRIFVAGLLAIAVPVAPAAADEEIAAFLTCGSGWVNDPLPVQGHRNKLVAEVNGGPVIPVAAGTDPITAEPASGVTIRCSVHVDGDGSHVAAGAYASQSAAFTSPAAVAVLPPTLLTLPDSSSSTYYLCTEFEWTTYLGSRRFYYHDGTGALSEDPGVPCAVAAEPE